MSKNTLYISFDGLCDPLGRSQVIPYLIGIASGGFQISVLSCEKTDRVKESEDRIRKQLMEANIDWHFILYDENGNFYSRFRYINKLKKIATELHSEKNFKLTHCRSYLAALIGLDFKHKYNIPFVFDMRGLWADERIDGKIWSKKNPLHFMAYSYFKRKEKHFLRDCDSLISLTQSGLDYLSNVFPEFKLKSKSTVIPCCTDTSLFKRPAKISITNPFASTDHILVYSGSIGTWYNTNEMIDCISEWKKQIPELKLLVLTKDIAEFDHILKNYSQEIRNIIKVITADRDEMPQYLSLAKACLFFIKPLHSKIASSPTKMAECWAMNLPVITNKGIGDNDQFIQNKGGGILINNFDKTSYETSCKAYIKFLETEHDCRAIALEYFDNKQAILKYLQVYNAHISE